MNKDISNTSITNTIEDIQNRLPQKIFLYKKCLLTTNDAVILRTSDADNRDDYHYAYRLIHHDKKTDRPFIVLHTSDNIDEAQRIVEQMDSADLRQEFPFMDDCYVVQLNYCGVTDERIQWYIV